MGHLNSDHVSHKQEQQKRAVLLLTVNNLGDGKYIIFNAVKSIDSI